MSPVYVRMMRCSQDDGGLKPCDDDEMLSCDAMMRCYLNDCGTEYLLFYVTMMKCCLVKLNDDGMSPILCEDDEFLSCANNGGIPLSSRKDIA
jgi:hypothetical protein